jgi:hypothetical protein
MAKIAGKLTDLIGNTPLLEAGSYAARESLSPGLGSCSNLSTSTLYRV